MSVRNLIILNNPAHWVFDIEEVEIVAARDYLADSQFGAIKNARVFNLCRSYRYQSIGYYVSLLAAARNHRAIPTIATMQDFRSQTIVRTMAEDVDAELQKTFSKVQENEYTLFIYFGQTVNPAFRQLGWQLYSLFQTPLLKIRFVRSEKWLIQQMQPLSLGLVPQEDQAHLSDFARQYFSRKRFRHTRIQQFAYDLAILVEPEEASPPSCRRALKKFAAAANKLNVYCEFITRDDYNRLSEFDALFIRVTTAVNHYSYRFARKAYAEGLAVIDDPWSILRCTNKVFLAERLAQAKLPTPQTVILQKDSLRSSLPAFRLQYPCVLKQPDSAFSMGVVKAHDENDLRAKLDVLFEKSDLVIAQQYMASDFDWRIGILDRKPIYACRYYMAQGHWQICNWASSSKNRFGRSETLPVEEAPASVVKTALKGANLIGNGLYGVDLKEVNGEVIMIEINDNPSIDVGVEDYVLKEKLYEMIIHSLIARIEDPRQFAALQQSQR